MKKVPTITHDEWVKEHFKVPTPPPPGAKNAAELQKETGLPSTTLESRLRKKVKDGELLTDSFFDGRYWARYWWPNPKQPLK